MGDVQVECSLCHSSMVLPDGSRYCPECGGPLASSPGMRIPSAPEGPIVRLCNVGKSFDGRRVLEDLSLEIRRGESLVIVGMSGSGKSVLMEHLIGFQFSDAGTVSIDGYLLDEATTEEELRRLRASVGMVFQGSALIDSLDVEDNVALPLIWRGRSRSEAGAMARELLGKLGLSPEQGRLMPAMLSGGMQKRVAIARALAAAPDLLLYDEPTTGLDPVTSDIVSELMREVRDKLPELTSVTITHDFLLAGHVADRVLYLDRDSGRLEEILGPRDITEILQRHGPDSSDASIEIRARLERAFRERTVSEQLIRGQLAETTWCQAIINVLSDMLRSSIRSFELLLRVGAPRDLAALARRFLEIALMSSVVVGLTGAFVGAMFAIQIAQGLSENQAPNYSPLPPIVGKSLIDKVGPLVLGLLLAGRISASVSAEIGGYRLSRQYDALRAMSVPHESYWLSPIFWASVAGLPVLALVLEGSAIVGAYLVTLSGNLLNTSYYFGHVLEKVTLASFLYGLFRSAVFGAAVSLIGYAHGEEEKRSSAAVGRSTTSAVVDASLAVIIIDFLLTLRFLR